MSKGTDIATLREEYRKHALDVHDVADDPLTQFSAWFGEALEVETREPNAMTLATVDGEGRPAARIVLLKGVDERGFSFYTNHESRKGEELAANPNATLVFHWMSLERQVRVDGTASKLDHEEASAYFAQRPRGSRLGAWASPQSRMIASREVLQERLAEVEKRFGDRDVPCPSNWGGYVVTPRRVEFWQGRPSRLHDRVVYDLADNGKWTVSRLAP